MKILIFVIFLIIWGALGWCFPSFQSYAGSFFAGIVFVDISEFLEKKLKRQAKYFKSKGGDDVQSNS